MSGLSPPILNPSPSPSDSSYLPAYYGKYDYHKRVGNWKVWDIRVQILCIISAQLLLHVLGSRRKWKISRMMNVIIPPLYLFSEFTSTITLGQLSRFNDCKQNSNVNILRVLWPATILFYLGGPDTITVSSLGEADTWGRHFAGLSIQGLRIGNFMWVAWTEKNLSLVALLMLFPGIVKYGEKVWNIWSRTEGHFEGFVRSDDLDQPASSINKAGPESALVLRAYYCFQTLKPHDLKYSCDRGEQKYVVTLFKEWIKHESDAKNAFKLIEIELGFMHDMLFNRIGTIFTIWGCIVRFISCSFSVCVLLMLVCYLYKYSAFSGFDPAISIILLLGAIFLDVAGVVVQLFSDWAVIWASRHPSKLLNPILRHQEHFISKRKRWSGCIGQCNLLNATPRKMNYSMIKIPPGLKDLIINQLREAWQNEADEVKLGPPLTSAMRSGSPFENLKEFKWSIGQAFGESIVTWHIVTEICYLLSEEHDKDISEQRTTAKALSHYMMYLLIWGPLNSAFFNSRSPVMRLCSYVEKNLAVHDNKKLHDLLLKADGYYPGQLPMRVRTLAYNLMEKENRWEIMSNIWVEMLSYAASNCPVRQHAENVIHGGEFLTHVWLLLVHFGVAKRLDLNPSQYLKSVLEKLDQEVWTCK